MTESRIQSEAFQWHWNSFPNERGRLFMVHNTPKNRVDGSRLKAMGMVAGVSDLCYITSEGKAVFLECKKPGQKQTEQQKWFERVANEANSHYHLFTSLKEFQEWIALYQK